MEELFGAAFMFKFPNGRYTSGEWYRFRGHDLRDRSASSQSGLWALLTSLIFIVMLYEYLFVNTEICISLLSFHYRTARDTVKCSSKYSVPC